MPASGEWSVRLVPPTIGEAGGAIEHSLPHVFGWDWSARVTETAAVVTESWSSSGPPAVSSGYAVTLERVRAVSVEGGAPIPTRAQPDLPGGLRAVAVEVPGEDIFERRTGPLRFTPLDEHGNALEAFQRTLRRPLEPDIRSWVAPKRPQYGVCGIHVAGVRGLIEKRGAVLAHISAVNGIIDRGLLPCADTGYKLGSWPLDVSVLLDAPQPGRSAPVAIPGMHSLAGHPGVFSEIIPGEKLLARRSHTAWLLVEGGEGLSERLAVLAHLHATIGKP